MNEKQSAKHEAEMHRAHSLTDWITQNHGTQRAFAASEGVAPAQVTQWLQKEFIVVDGVMYSRRRVLKPVDPEPTEG